MVDDIVNFLLGIPQAVGAFGEWLISPINETFMNISPLALFSVAGVSILIGVIVLHVVRLFTI